MPSDSSWLWLKKWFYNIIKQHLLVSLWLTLTITVYILNSGVSLWSCFSFISFTKELVFGSWTSITRHNMFFGCFLDGWRFFREPAEIVCNTFEAFSRGYILWESEIISFLPILFKLFSRGTEECFHVFIPIFKIWKKEQWHFAGPHY